VRQFGGTHKTERIMKKIILILTAILLTHFCFGQKKVIDSLFGDFKQKSFYGKVYPAEKQLEKYQKIIIPKLVELLKDTSYVKLTNTADLIYPGSTEFYGHGHFVPYDMDWISVRSGWLLEELTFQDFGYKNSKVNDETLFKFAKENYKEYLENGNYELNWKNKTDKEKISEYRKILSIKTEEWWKENKKNWNRFSAIKEALKSNDENRLSNVFQYLRYGETICDNLNENSFRNEIKPLVLILKESNRFPDIQIQIKLLLESGISPKIIN
jgi:hypothetical protein